jgi:hypothetical protein
MESMRSEAVGSRIYFAFLSSLLCNTVLVHSDNVNIGQFIATESLEYAKVLPAYAAEPEVNDAVQVDEPIERFF